MLSPKEKAEWLVLKYLRIENNTKEWFNTLISKQCAIIAVDEMIKLNGEYYLINSCEVTKELYIKINSYLFEIKQEIEKL